jgi:manganese/zinc/iron transport system substrate-binding protein
MRKFLLLFVVMFGLFLGVMGCGKTSSHRQTSLAQWMQPSSTLKVLSTTTIIDDLVGRVGQQYITHRALIQGQLDPHSYELVKGDDEIMSSADVIFYNGLELEHGASLRYHLKMHIGAHSLGDFLAEKKPTSLISFQGQLDPHIWMDVGLFSEVITLIVETLSQKDPTHAMQFKNNGDLLKKEMLALDHSIDHLIKEIPKEKRYLITSHDAFFYFTRRYLAEEDEMQNSAWKGRFVAPEGLAPDGQISPKDIQYIIEYAMKHGVKIIFPESNLNQDAIKKVVSILNQKGMKASLAQEVLYGDAMGDQGSNADSYLKMMQHNAEVIALYLKGESHG